MKKKQSFYNLWIKNNGEDILYNVLTDTTIQFEKEEVEGIQFYLEHLDEFEKEYPDIFKKFESSGFITDADMDEKDYILFQNRMNTLVNKSYHLTINPTLQCNYKCWYCCVEDADTQYEQRPMDHTTIEKVKKHIRFMIEKEHISSLYLDWFGGEPLMYFNEVIMPISEIGLKLAEDYNIPFFQHATTNAYYIDDHMIDQFNKVKMNHFQIPIDGHEKKHNSVKNMEGEGHYRKIINSVNAICERVENAGIILRINYDHQTLKSILSVIEDIRPENREKIMVDFQRVWQIGVTKDESGNNQLLLDVREAFSEAGFATYYAIFSHKNFRSCYSDSFYHRAVNYDGKIFKCTARNYADDLCIGTFNDDGSIAYNRKLLSTMYSEATFKNEKCLACKILPLCYGPCIQKFYEIKTGKSKLQCPYEKSEMTFNAYIMDKAKTRKSQIMS